MSKEHKLLAAWKLQNSVIFNFPHTHRHAKFFLGFGFVHILHHFTCNSSLNFRLSKLRENLKDGIAWEAAELTQGQNTSVQPELPVTARSLPVTLCC